MTASARRTPAVGEMCAVIDAVEPVERDAAHRGVHEPAAAQGEADVADQAGRRAPSVTVNIRTEAGPVLSMSTSLEIVSTDGGRTRAMSLMIRDQSSTSMTGRPSRACLN